MPTRVSRHGAAPRRRGARSRSAAVVILTFAASPFDDVDRDAPPARPAPPRRSPRRPLAPAATASRQHLAPERLRRLRQVDRLPRQRFRRSRCRPSRDHALHGVAAPAPRRSPRRAPQRRRSRARSRRRVTNGRAASWTSTISTVARHRRRTRSPPNPDAGRRPRRLDVPHADEPRRWCMQPRASAGQRDDHFAHARDASRTRPRSAAAWSGRRRPATASARPRRAVVRAPGRDDGGHVHGECLPEGQTIIISQPRPVADDPAAPRRAPLGERSCAARAARRPSESGREWSSVTSPGQVISRPLRITWRLPAMLTGTTGSPASIASRKMPPLKRADRAIDAARAFGKHDERSRAADEPRHLLRRCPAPGFLRSTSRWPVAPQVPAEERKPAERLLGDDAQLQRKRGEHHRDVVDALVIRREHVAAIPVQLLEAADVDAHAGRLQDAARPTPARTVAEVAASNRPASRGSRPCPARSCRRRWRGSERRPSATSETGDHFAFCWCSPRPRRSTRRRRRVCRSPAAARRPGRAAPGDAGPSM